MVVLPLMVCFVLLWSIDTMPQASSQSEKSVQKWGKAKSTDTWKIPEEKEIKESLKDNPISTRTFTKHKLMRWRKVDGTVRIPYSLSYNFTTEEKARIMQAISYFNGLNCVLWDKKTDDDQDFVLFRLSTEQRCQSAVGRVGGKQRIQLHNDCFDSSIYFSNTLEHEMMHTMGFYHEHQRPDRDCYIRIKEGIEQTDDYQIKLLTDTTFPFDFTSIMIYDSPGNLESKVEGKAISPGEGLSEIDKARLKYMYCDGPHYCTDHKQECRETKRFLASCPDYNK